MIIVIGNYLNKRLAHRERKGKDMTKLNIQAVTEMGSVVYTTITVSDDYTMTEVVRTIKENGYEFFRLTDTMKRFVKV